MNLGSPTDIGLSAVSLDMLTTESRRGGIRSLIRSNFLASSKLPILSLNCSRARCLCMCVCVCVCVCVCERERERERERETDRDRDREREIEIENELRHEIKLV